MQALSSTQKAEKNSNRKAPPLKGEVGGEWAEPFPVCRVQVRENICLLPWDKWLPTVDTAFSHGDGDRSVVQTNVRSSTLSQCRLHAFAALTSVLSLLFTRIHSSKGSGGLCAERVGMSASPWTEWLSVALPQTRSITSPNISKKLRLVCCSQWSCWLCLGRPPTPSCRPHRWLGGSTAGKLHWWLTKRKRDPVNRHNRRVTQFQSPASQIK